MSPPISWRADPGVSRRRGNGRPPARVLGEVERAPAPGGDVPRETCPGRGRRSSPGWEPPGVRTGSRCVATVGCDGDSGATPADLGAGVRGHTRVTLTARAAHPDAPGERTARRSAGPQGGRRGRGCSTRDRWERRCGPAGTGVRPPIFGADTAGLAAGPTGARRPGRAHSRGQDRHPLAWSHEAGPADPGLRTVVSRLRRTRARGRFGSTFFGGNMGTGSRVARNPGPERFRRVPCQRDVSRETSPSLVHCLTLFMGGHRMGRVGDDERSPG